MSAAPGTLAVVPEAPELSSRELLEIASRVCTDRQLEAVVLFEAGYSLNRLARTLGVDKSTVRGHLQAATVKIGRELRAA